jgi:prevent-host-death family protein
MTRVTAAQARRDFSEVINRAAYGKERVIITRHDADLVALVPIEEIRMIDAAREVLRANPAFARDLALIDTAREAQAAWGRVEAEVDTLVLTPESFDVVLDLIEHPRTATPALRDLMRPDTTSGSEDQ